MHQTTFDSARLELYDCSDVNLLLRQPLGLGCLIGSVLSIGFRMRPNNWPASAFKNLEAFKAELVTVCAAVAAIALIPAVRWILRFARAWWAGITTVSTLFAACGIVSLLTYGPRHPILLTVLELAILSLLLLTEYLRQRPRLPAVVPPKTLNTPIAKGAGSMAGRWTASSSDDPITNWSDDIVGRTALVELLADHALRKRTPTIALHGALGDGKTSVLNLLKTAVEGQVILICFSAWLPGSERTLSADLFKDLADECRRYIYIPALRKRALSYARMISSSVNYLGGLKEVIPALSQREEIEELRRSFSRVPLPILVLLDDMDRMQRDELEVLLKILRGASSLPNVTFVCAFSLGDVTKTLSTDRALAPDYLEKFFPVSLRLSPPSPTLIAECFQTRLKNSLTQQQWFSRDDEGAIFEERIGNIWRYALETLCTNLRKAGLLINDVLAAGESIVGEVNPLDLVMIEAIRRFCSRVYDLVRINGIHLTDGATNTLLIDEDKPKAFFGLLSQEADTSEHPAAIRYLLYSLFPKYAQASSDKAARISQYKVSTDREFRYDQMAIRNADYFQVYFRSALPEEMFSNAELQRILVDLNRESVNVEAVFNEALDSIPAQSAKRADFLWKLSMAVVSSLDDGAAECLAYAAAKRAADFAYDMMNVGEPAYALNIVFHAAQKVAESHAQQVLEGAMNVCSDDTFAFRLLRNTDRDRNDILRNYSTVDHEALKRVFVQRMRRRYGLSSDTTVPSIQQFDWWAFRLWAEHSEEDREIERDFWRRFIGGSRKRLAQAINFVYPINVHWNQDPSPDIDLLFPLDELDSLLTELPDEPLDEVETRGVDRMRALRQGNFKHSPFS